MSGSATALAPGPVAAAPGPLPVPSPPAPPPLLRDNCQKGDFFCYDTSVSDAQITTALWTFFALGAACLLVFGALRGKLPLYRARLFLPNVLVKPPPLPIGGWNHFWSWLVPVFTTGDTEIIHTAGLDSLMLIWTLSLGIQFFLPVTILGCAVLLPMNHSVNRVDLSYQSNSNRLQKLTLANIPKGSQLYWVPFVYCFLIILYAMWLLIKYYQSYVVLRQHYLTGGEALMNDWHQQYLTKQKSMRELHPKHDRTKAWRAVGRLFNPAKPMDTITEELDEVASMRSSFRGPLGSAMSRLGTMQRRAPDMLMSTRERRDRAIRQRRSGLSARESGETPRSEQGDDALSQRSSFNRISPGRGNPRGPSRLGAVPLTPDGTEPSPQTYTTPHTASSHLQAPLSQAGMSRFGLDSQHSGDSGFYGLGRPEPVSLYETNMDPDDMRRERVQAWWKADHTADGKQIWGKPSVAHAKVINTVNEDGNPVGMNAQQYAVLVMDVPNFTRQRATVMRRARRKAWWARMWFKFTLWWQRKVLLRKHVMDANVLDKSKGARTPYHRRTGSSKRSTEDLDAAEAGKGPGTVPAVQASEASEVVRHRRRLSQVPEGDDPMEPPPGAGLPEEHADRTGLISPTARQSMPSVVENGDDAHSVVLHGHLSNGSLEGTPKHCQNGHHHSPDSPRDSPRGIGSGKPGTLKPNLTVDVTAPPRKDPLASPFQEKDQETALVPERGSDEDSDTDFLTTDKLVAETFYNLFPDAFSEIMPIRNHKPVDVLLGKWNAACARLEAAEQAFIKKGKKERPLARVGGCCCCGGEKKDAIDHWASEVRDLEKQIVKARKAVEQGPATSSYFVFFHRQKDAAIAAQANLHPEDGHSFRVFECPGPEEVNWTALWLTWQRRDVRELIVLIPIILIMLLPVGLFSGAVAQATIAICGSPTNKFYSAWYCTRSATARNIVSAVLPAILVTVWRSVVMPMVLYRCALCEGKWPSMSSMDRRIGTLFFWWDIFNIFLGAMLGGSIFSQLGQVVNDPGSIPRLIGTALPTSSNFFINYMVLQGFTMIPFRMMFQYMGFLVQLFRLMGCCLPNSGYGTMAAKTTVSIRYGREVGSIMLVYLIALAYAPSCPLILPFTLIYFFGAWTYWRYHILYISERAFESGGRVWDNVFVYVCVCLFIMELFTGCIFLSNAAYAQATLLWAFSTILLYKFYRYCYIRYGQAVQHMPLEMAAAAPEATVNPRVYLPPAMRPNAAGWHPEYGKAWCNWGMPAYSF